MLTVDAGRLVAQEAERVAALAGGVLDAAVPACGTWTAADVIVHLGHVYERTTFLLTEGALDRPSEVHGFERSWPREDDVVAWSRVRGTGG